MLRPSVISSAYSRSPPTGTPRAITLTFTDKSFDALVNIEGCCVAFQRGTERRMSLFVSGLGMIGGGFTSDSYF